MWKKKIAYLVDIPGDDRAGEWSLGFLASGTSSVKSLFNLSRFFLKKKANWLILICINFCKIIIKKTHDGQVMNKINVPVCSFLHMGFSALGCCNCCHLQWSRSRILFHSYRFIQHCLQLHAWFFWSWMKKPQGSYKDRV